MTRLPQLTDAQAAQHCPADLLDAIRKRRGGQLLELDRLLLHSPALATGWGELMGRVRGQFELSPLLRELAMCAVAVLTGAAYELHHHAPLYRQAGATAGQEAALRRLADDEAVPRDPVFDPAQQAVLQLTLEMTRRVQVADATFAAARAAVGSDQQMMELVAVVASYNMVARILVAMQLTP